jgi:DNA polymerase-1
MFELFEDENSEFYDASLSSKKLLLVDGSYAQYRSFYGYNVENFKTSDGKANNCIYGVAKTLINLVNLENPTHIAFAYDLGRKGHRKDLLPQYKEGRQKTPDELIEQFEPVKEMLDLAQVPRVEQERLEADDIIATLASQAEAQKWDVRVFSSDKDMFQLVTDKVNVIRPNVGRAGFHSITPEVVVHKYQLTPEQYPDLAALVGEGADNIPGVPKVGEKTAVKWLLQYGSLDNLLKNADEVPGKVGENLREHIDQVKLNRQINQLLRDADLTHTLGDLELKPPKIQSVNEFFEQWEMPSLLNKFKW